MATTAAMTKLAEDYGYQLAFLKSDPGLYAVFQKAVAGKWDANRFVAAVRNTSWYKTHSETWRTNTQLRYTDPKSYSQKLAASRASLAELAHQMGMPVPGADMARLAEQALMFDWSESQIRNQLARFSTTTYQRGEAGNIIQGLKQTAFRNGVTLSDSYYNEMLRKISLGEMTIENAQQGIRATYAKSVAPGFQKELEQGTDLYDLASPYMQSMAKTLEINPADIDLFDPTIRKALASSNDKDGQVGSVPLWQFERELKKDSRWMKTNGARDEVDKTTRSLAQMFGKAV